MATIDISVPDIGDFKDVAVIEVLVKPGDSIKAEQSLITVESDKASMEIPSSAAGVVKEIKVKVGDKVNQGTVLLSLETGAAATLRSLLVVGFCGGFTTFSTFSWQTLEQMQKGQWGAAAANVLLSVSLCLLAVWLGFKLGRA